MCVTCRPIIDDKVHHGVVAWAAWRASPFTAPMALAPLSPPTLSTGTDISASLRGWWRRRHVSKRSRGGRRRMLGRSVSRGVGAPKLVRSSHPHLYLVQISAQVQPRVELQFTNIYYGNSDGSRVEGEVRQGVAEVMSAIDNFEPNRGRLLPCERDDGGSDGTAKQ